jgi:hypothetical protein
MNTLHFSPISNPTTPQWGLAYGRIPANFAGMIRVKPKKISFLAVVIATELGFQAV